MHVKLFFQNELLISAASIANAATSGSVLMTRIAYHKYWNVHAYRADTAVTAISLDI